MNCTIVASEAGISSPEPPMLPPRRWASRRAAAEHLACAERTPDQMVADGRITAYRFEGFAHRQVRPRRDRRLAEAVHWTGCRVVTAPEGAVVSNVIMGETGEP